MLNRAVPAVLVLCGVAVSAFCVADQARNGGWGGQDFLVMWAAARTVPGAGMYDPAVTNAIRAEAGGPGVPDLVYIRPPFLALLVRPLAELPFSLAGPLWLGLNAAALAAVAWLWPSQQRWWLAVALTWSLPIVGVLSNGQELCILLLLLAAALRWAEGRPWLAGAALALCATKYHLFLLVPLVIVGQRRWRMLGGAAGCGAVLTALSFAAAGWSWPQSYWQILAYPRIDRGLEIMPNLRSMFRGAAFEGAVPWIALAGFGLLCWMISRRSDLETALGLALAGGLLATRHCYLSDCTLLVPFLVSAAVRQTGWRRAVLVFSLTPVPPFLLLLNVGTPNLGVLSLAAATAVLAVGGWRRERQPAPVPAPV